MYYSQPTIFIDGKEYSVEMARCLHPGIPSELQSLFATNYGAESFHASLASFLTEWFDESETLKVHTSGSTGKPKELWVQKRRMVNSAKATVSFLGLKAGDCALLCMPLPYIAGKMVVVRSLITGLNLQLVTPCGHPMAAIDKVPDFVAMTPMQVFNTLAIPAEAERLKQVRHLIIGGGAVNSEMADVLKDFPHAVWSTYGMTETLSHIALRRLSGEKASTWYTPFEGVNVSMSPTNTLVIHAPNVCPDILQTNDIVEFNRAGQFRILGRKDNTINTGGIKVQIEEVESKLQQTLSIPFMITAAPHPKFGEQIVLLVEYPALQNTNTNCTPISKMIQEAVSTLPTYWQPKVIKYIRQLPLTGTGKPDRATARQLASSICYNP